MELKVRNTEKALDDINRAIEKDPSNPKSYIIRGQARADKEDFDSAIKDYLWASEIAPETEKNVNDLIEEAYIKGGISSSDRGNYRSAVRYFKKYLESGSDNPDIYFYLGDAFMNLDNPREARKNLEKVIEIDPESEVAEDAREMLEALDEMSGN